MEYGLRHISTRYKPLIVPAAPRQPQPLGELGSTWARHAFLVAKCIALNARLDVWFYRRKIRGFLGKPWHRTIKVVSWSDRLVCLAIGPPSIGDAPTPTS